MSMSWYLRSVRPIVYQYSIDGWHSVLLITRNSESEYLWESTSESGTEDTLAKAQIAALASEIQRNRRITTNMIEEKRKIEAATK